MREGTASWIPQSREESEKRRRGGREQRDLSSHPWRPENTSSTPTGGSGSLFHKRHPRQTGSDRVARMHQSRWNWIGWGTQRLGGLSSNALPPSPPAPHSEHWAAAVTAAVTPPPSHRTPPRRGQWGPGRRARRKEMVWWMHRGGKGTSTDWKERVRRRRGRRHSHTSTPQNTSCGTSMRPRQSLTDPLKDVAIPSSIILDCLFLSRYSQHTLSLSLAYFSLSFSHCQSNQNGWTIFPSGLRHHCPSRTWIDWASAGSDSNAKCAGEWRDRRRIPDGPSRRCCHLEWGRRRKRRRRGGGSPRRGERRREESKSGRGEGGSRGLSREGGRWRRRDGTSRMQGRTHAGSPRWPPTSPASRRRSLCTPTRWRTQSCGGEWTTPTDRRADLTTTTTTALTRPPHTHWELWVGRWRFPFRCLLLPFSKEERRKQKNFSPMKSIFSIFRIKRFWTFFWIWKNLKKKHFIMFLLLPKKIMMILKNKYHSWLSSLISLTKNQGMKPKCSWIKYYWMLSFKKIISSSIKVTSVR